MTKKNSETSMNNSEQASSPWRNVRLAQTQNNQQTLTVPAGSEHSLEEAFNVQGDEDALRAFSTPLNKDSLARSIG